MAKHHFTTTERFALWWAYDGQCFWCREPISFAEMEGDHLLPESLAAGPDRLKGASAAFGLPTPFSLNDYPNWVASCRQCNGRKHSTTYESSPIFVTFLKIAEKRSAACRELAQQLASQGEKDKVFSKLVSMIESGKVSTKDIEQLEERLLDELTWAVTFVSQAVSDIHIAGKWWLVQRHGGDLAWVVGKVGGKRLSGLTSVGPKPDLSMRCESCGNFGPWRGINCQSCGHSQDPDHGE